MKVYISADFESATGVTTLEHTLAAQGAEFEPSRAFWVDDINAMIEGALEAGVREFLVNYRVLYNFSLVFQLLSRGAYVEDV